MKCANCGNKDKYTLLDEDCTIYCYKCNHRTDKETGKDALEVLNGADPLAETIGLAVAGALLVGGVGYGIYRHFKKKDAPKDKKKLPKKDGFFKKLLDSKNKENK